MVDYAPPWDALPRDSLHAAHEMPLSQVKKSAGALAALLDENKDEQVLKEACLGLCQLFGEGIQNDRIQAILDANVVPKLVALLRPSKSRSVPISVQSAALQVLGNVACGDDRQTQVVIDSNALPCLRALLSSADRSIRKEVCWIVSNITESSHQVQDVLDADILPPLLKLLDNQDAACREDATWVLFNLSSNRDPNQIAYLAEKNGVRALCNLLTCSKELDVLWKGCGTVAAVALKGLRNILISGQIAAASDPNGYNKMASLVAEAHGVERIEALTTHVSPDVRNRARILLERMFGAEPTTADLSPPLPPPAMTGLSSLSSPPPPPPLHNGCSCAYQQHQHHHHSHPGHHYQTGSLYDVASNMTGHSALSSAAQLNTTLSVEHGLPSHLHHDADLVDVPGSTSGSSTDSDPEDDDSDSDLIPPPPAPCSCVLCTDPSPLAERRPRGRGSSDDSDMYKKGQSESRHSSAQEARQICNFCSGGGRLGDGRAGLAAKLGRAVRLGHPHCIAVLLSRMTWSQRVAATEAPALLHPGGGPPDGGVGSSLPAVILAAQLGKPECLGLLLRRCKPDLDITHGKKRLTALAWAAHKGYMRCCQLLIEYGADPATKCGDAVTALHLASSGGGHFAICKLLIDHKAPVSARSAKKQTPLCLAAQKGFEKVVQLLLDHGADPSNEDEGKYTPLHLAASNGFVKCVDLLLKAGAQVDATTRNGVTPLHYAVQGGHASAVRLLINANAKVDCNRKPLLLIAADDGNLEVVQILLDAKPEIDCKANIKATLDKDIEVSDYLTPLHLASSKGHHDVVEVLLARGAEVDEVTSKSGWSALDFAVLNGHADCAMALLRRGATVTDNCKSIGRNNWTLVQYAAHHGAKDVVRLLIQRLKEQRMTSANSPQVSSRATVNGMSLTSSIHPDSSFSGTNNTNAGATKAAYEMDDSGSHLHCCSPEIADREERPYLNLDDHDTCQHHEEVEASGPAPHRYDPRSLEGDESGFGTGPGYSNSTPTYESVSRSTTPRRRVVKEDRQVTLRAREIKKREAEATEARDRLEEAITQRSITKLTEAISHVSKLVLHLATTVGSDVTGAGGHMDHGDMNGYSPHPDTYNHAGHVHSPGGGHLQHSSSPSSSPAVSAPLAMEVGLGIEVQKARKILASLLAEEKRLREEKEREVADTKRDNAQQTVRKAITIALEGGDPRSLLRATNRATRTILDKDDPAVVEATAVGNLISRLEHWEGLMKTAIENRDLDDLLKSLTETSNVVVELMEKGGQGAAMRVFGGVDPAVPLKEASTLLGELRDKRESEMAKEAEARDRERSAQEKLAMAVKSNDIVELESALEQANSALLSKDSELSRTIESAKKVMAKWLKSERRKLRQASNSNDPEVIEAAAAAAEKFGLHSLQSDIDSANTLALKLRKQATTVRNLEDAIDNADVTALSEIRVELNSLGMFSEAEQARAEVERIQRATRARTLLEGAVEDAKECQEPLLQAVASSTEAPEDVELKSSWKWPDAQRLRDLSERARQYGPGLSVLCDSADQLAKDLASLGRRILSLAVQSSDARGIAAVISGYENSFVNVAHPQFFDLGAAEHSIREARKRLAIVQAMDQASVKAEAAQVKVEYALATSRRSAARNRGSRHAHSRSNATSSEGHGGVGTTMQNGTADSGTRSPSSLSSDFIEDDSSEMDHNIQMFVTSETSSLRTGEPQKHVARRSRSGTHSSDDSAIIDALSELAPSLPGECSHFYLFKEGTTVCCARCGNLRSSSNPEWLARVKRRGNKIPMDTTTGSLPSVGSGSDLHAAFSSNGALVGAQNRSPSATNAIHSGIGNGRPTRSLPMTSLSQHAPSFPLNSTGIGRDSGGGRSQPHTSAHAASMNMMAQLLRQSNAHGSKGGNQGLGQGRGRMHGNQLTSPVDAHMQGMTSMYGSGLNNGRSPIAGSLPMSAALPIGGNFGNASNLQQNLAQTLPSTLAASVHGYGLGSASGMSPMGTGGNMRSHGDLSAGRGMGQHGMRMEHMNANQSLGHQNVSGGATHVGTSRPVASDEFGLDFANENFGFDIDAIVDDNPSPRHKPVSSAAMGNTQPEMSKMYVPGAHPQHNGYYRR